MMTIGTLIFAGLPLLGWGPGDVRGFLENPVRQGYLVVAVLFQIGTVIAVPGIGRKRPGESTVRRQRLANAVMQILSLALVVGAPFCDRRGIAVMPVEETGRWSGLALFAAGMVLTVWAEAKLGRFFSLEITIQKDHALVTDGLYRYLRHPRYLGIILFSLGISLVFRTWVAAGLAAACGAVLLWRIGDEESLMRRAFPHAWEAYAARSWRLFPFLY